MLETFVASRYLITRRREGVISVIAGFSLVGIALGVATLIVVMAVMNGFRDELLDRVLGLNGHLNVFSVGRPFDNYPEVAADLETLATVATATPYVESQALIMRGEKATGVAIRGLAPQDFAQHNSLGQNIIQGRAEDFRENNIALGVRLAERLGIDVGDPVRLISPQVRGGPFGSMPRLKDYRAAVIFETGLFEYDNAFLYMPLEQAKRFARTGEAVTGLELRLHTPDQSLISTQAEIVSRYGNAYRLFSWEQANASFFTALQVERNVMFLILTLIVLVAAFNIIAGLTMLVKDKRRDIGILRSMGASRMAILRIFFITGAAIGVIGTGAGVGLGVLVAQNIETIRQAVQALSGTEVFSAEVYFLSQLPSRLHWPDVARVIGMALGLSFLATLYPAWRAARMDPVRALV